MKINLQKPNLSFKKTLIGNCNILKDKKPYQCNMYMLDNSNREDCDFFLKPSKQNYELWNNPAKSSYFWISMMEGWHPNEEIYILEDQKALFFIETCPKFSYDKEKNRNVKYIGESMLAFLAGIAQKRHNPFISVPAYRGDAIDFYTKKCGFVQADFDYDFCLVLTEDNYDKLIKQNELHTGKKINIFT